MRDIKMQYRFLRTYKLINEVILAYISFYICYTYCIYILYILRIKQNVLRSPEDRINKILFHFPVTPDRCLCKIIFPTKGQIL